MRREGECQLLPSSLQGCGGHYSKPKARDSALRDVFKQSAFGLSLQSKLDQAAEVFRNLQARASEFLGALSTKSAFVRHREGRKHSPDCRLFAANDRASRETLASRETKACHRSDKP
jgi:hypothetical protein